MLLLRPLAGCSAPAAEQSGEGEGEPPDGGEGEGEGEPPDAWLSTRSLILADGAEIDGSSQRERRGAPVEVPLVAGGWLNSDVLGLWRLDGDTVDSSVHGNRFDQDVDRQLEAVAGHRNDEGGALRFGGPGGVALPPALARNTSPALTMCIWVKPGILFPGGNAVPLVTLATCLPVRDRSWRC